MGRRGAIPARVELLHVVAGAGGPEVGHLPGLADARRARRACRRNSVCAARRISDVGPEPDVCTRARNFGGRRSLVRHQSGGSGDCDRGADPHRQARAQDTAFALAGGGRLRRHLLSGAAFPVDCRSCCCHRLLRRAEGSEPAWTCDKSRISRTACGRPLAPVCHRRDCWAHCVVRADRICCARS